MEKPNVTQNQGLGLNKNSQITGNTGWIEIYQILKELFITQFKWNNLPTTVNQRYLELALFDYGKVVFFKDDLLGILALKATQVGMLNVYYEPTQIQAFGGGGYQKKLTNFKDCVVLYNNYVRDTPSIRMIDYAKRIYNIEKTIDINVQQQKTPMIIKTSKKQQLTVRNFYQQYDSFKPVIVIDDDMDLSKIGVIPTKADFIARDLMDLKKQIWNEALSYIGIENNSAEKNERLTANEVMVSNGLAIASKNSKQETRQEGIDRVNMMFGQNIEIDVNSISIMEIEGGKQEEKDGEGEGKNNE